MAVAEVTAGVERDVAGRGRRDEQVFEIIETGAHISQSDRARDMSERDAGAAGAAAERSTVDGNGRSAVDVQIVARVPIGVDIVEIKVAAIGEGDAVQNVQVAQRDLGLRSGNDTDERQGG